MPAISHAFEFTFTDRPTTFTATEVVWPGVILLDNRNFVPIGTTLTYYSKPVPAAGFYNKHNALHTVTYGSQSFTGHVNIQGSLSDDPTNDADFFDIPNTAYTSRSDLTIKFHTGFANFRGNFTYIRAKVAFTEGIVTQILYNF